MKSRIQGSFLAFILSLFLSSVMVPVALAAPFPNSEGHQGECLLCHAQESFFAYLENGESISLTVTTDHTKNSIHWDENIYCADCHTDQSDNPHPNPDTTTCKDCHPNNEYDEEVNLANISFKLAYLTLRDYQLNLNNICKDCHQSEAERSADSTHQMVFDQGNLSAPICTDCHKSHFVVKPNQPRSMISEICSE
ncbi:MAG: hypothetical protein HOH75_06260, partial [Chloroflexi bacterium]|nr:hypothetical protein [Chloroflexota bacterium]